MTRSSYRSLNTSPASSPHFKSPRVNFKSDAAALRGHNKYLSYLLTPLTWWETAPPTEVQTGQINLTITKAKPAATRPLDSVTNNQQPGSRRMSHSMPYNATTAKGGVSITSKAPDTKPFGTLPSTVHYTQFGVLHNVTIQQER